MKTLILICCISLNTIPSFSQQYPHYTSNPTDSVRSKRSVSDKITTVNGEPMPAKNDIIDNLSRSKTFSILFNAIRTAELIETFKSKGPITIFAADNTAFSKLPQGKLDTLLKSAHKPDLQNFLTYQAIPGQVSSKDIAKQIKDNNGTATFITIAGGKLTAQIDKNRNIVLTDESGKQVVISQFDIQQSNGMLHVVKDVLIPKNKVNI